MKTPLASRAATRAFTFETVSLSNFIESASAYILIATIITSMEIALMWVGRERD